MRSVGPRVRAVIVVVGSVVRQLKIRKPLLKSLKLRLEDDDDEEACSLSSLFCWSDDDGASAGDVRADDVSSLEVEGMMRLTPVRSSLMYSA